MQNSNQDISKLALLNAGDEDELMDADQFKTIVMGMKLTQRPVIFAAYYYLLDDDLERLSSTRFLLDIVDHSIFYCTDISRGKVHMVFFLNPIIR
jgi:hypothetical protein